MPQENSVFPGLLLACISWCPDKRNQKGSVAKVVNPHLTPICLFFVLLGPFKLCEYLFGSWLIRIGVWTIAVLALTCNALVTSTVFRAAVYISSIKLLIGLIAAVNMLMGVSSAVLAGVDAFTFGSFAQHGAWWEQAVGCQVVGFLSIFASESSVFLLTLAALERGWSVKCSAKFETQAPFPSLRATLALCALLAGTVPPGWEAEFAGGGISKLPSARRDETKNNLRVLSELVRLLRMHETVPEERISTWWHTGGQLGGATPRPR